MSEGTEGCPGRRWVAFGLVALGLLALLCWGWVPPGASSTACQLTENGAWISVDWTSQISVSTIDSGTESTWQRLIDVSANFTGTGVASGDYVHNITDDTWAAITSVNSSIELTIDSNIIHYKECSVAGCHGSVPRQHRKAIELLSQGKIDISRFITDRFSLDEISNAFRAVEDRSGMKAVVHP